MQEKLEKLLNTININKDNLIYYEDGKLEKVKIVDNLRLWEVIIKLGSNLPLEVYLELENKMREVFNKIEVIRVKINTNSNNYEQDELCIDEEALFGKSIINLSAVNA